jgi:hypothetical protein
MGASLEGVTHILAEEGGRRRTPRIASQHKSPGRKSGGGVMPGHAGATNFRPALSVSETPTHSRLTSADAAIRMVLARPPSLSAWKTPTYASEA